MRMFASMLIMTVFATTTPFANATVFDKKRETAAEEAANNQLPAVTIWISASSSFRRKPESSFSREFNKCWIPAFAGMTTSNSFYQF
jgi:hypothetical protein